MEAASLQIDVDGFEDIAPGMTPAACRARGLPGLYQTGVRRFARLLGDRGLVATFFIVGRDAELPENRAVLADLQRDGHELANHSASHPVSPSFRELPLARQLLEVDRGHQALLDATGIAPVGFKAPAYSVADGRLLDHLLRLGYTYDSSVFPAVLTPLLSLAQYALTGQRRAKGHWGALPNSLAPQEPYHPSAHRPWRRGAHPLVEVPVSTWPLLRLPFHASIGYATTPAWTRLGIAAARRVRRPLVFQLHAIELAAPSEMPAEVHRLRPGATRSLEVKLRWIAAMLDAVRADREVMTTAELARRANAGAAR